MPIRTLFPTHVYEDAIDDPALIDDLAHSVRSLAEEDGAGRAWSRRHGYRGYTSYASLNDLPRRDPSFAALSRLLTRHVAAFARDAGWTLERPMRLDSIWANLMKPGASHSGHIHPHSAVSGTLYLEIPDGAGALRLEDPRLPMLMAAPERPDRFVHLQPRPGTLYLWESWLRHEVMPHTGKGERLSVSFNYR